MQLLAIEQELSGPDSAEALAKYDAVLVNLDARVKRALDQGLAPDEYSKCTKLAEAVTIARKLLRLQIQKKG